MRQSIYETNVLSQLIGRWKLQKKASRKSQVAKHDFAEDDGIPEILTEALKWFQKKKVITKTEFLKLSAKLRWDAFTVARPDKKVLSSIKDKLISALDSGQTIEDFTADIDKVFDAAGLTKLNPYHLDNVFLTNALSGYAEGRRKVMDELSIDEFPLRQVSTVGDSRVRDSHKLLDGFTAPSNDPVWIWLKTPFSYRCRCIISPVYAGEGLTASASLPDIRGKKGFEFLNVGSYGGSKASLVGKIDIDKKIQEKSQGIKTISEIEKLAKKQGIKYADFKGLDVDVANDMNKIMADYFAKYPELKKHINFVGTIQGFNRKDYELALEDYIGSLMKKGATRAQAEKYAKSIIELEKVPKNLWAQAAWDGEVNGIMINNKFGKDTKSFNSIIKKDDGKNGWHPYKCEKINSVIHHELGHKLFDMIGDSPQYNKLADLYSSISFDKIESGLSKYATESLHEFIAEGWAEFMSSPNPRPISKKIGNLINKAALTVNKP